MNQEPNVIKIDGEEYEVIPRETAAASKILTDLYIKLGRPTTPLSESGEKLMKVMIAVWEDLYPQDARDWYEDRKEYKNAEMSISEQVSKGTGRSLASFPKPIFKMIRALFPEFKHTRENFIKLVQKYPMFQMANKI